jgi:hypothetical protein
LFASCTFVFLVVMFPCCDGDETVLIDG